MPKQNETIIFHFGDFNYFGPYQVVSNFSLSEQFNNWENREPEVVVDMGCNAEVVEIEFPYWLEAEGFIKDLGCKEVDLIDEDGNYINEGDWD